MSFKSLKTRFLNSMLYPAYLNSPYWRGLRDRIKKNAGHKCQICNSNKSLEVHHRTYDNRGDLDNEIKDLVCLCKECHEWYREKNKKSELNTTTSKKLIPVMLYFATFFMLVNSYFIYKELIVKHTTKEQSYVVINPLEMVTPIIESWANSFNKNLIAYILSQDNQPKNQIIANNTNKPRIPEGKPIQISDKDNAVVIDTKNQPVQITEPLESETLIVLKPQKTYSSAYSFNGTGDGEFKSEPFTVTGDKLKVVYECGSGQCDATVRTLNKQYRHLDFLHFMYSGYEEGAREWWIHHPGEYYIDADIKGDYKITVFEYS